MRSTWPCFNCALQPAPAGMISDLMTVPDVVLMIRPSVAPIAVSLPLPQYHDDRKNALPS